MARSRSSRSDESDKALREEYIELHKSYAEGEQKAYEHFDRAILTLASTAFGFSLALAQFMAASHKLTATWLLAGSWFGFIAAILCILVSYLFSQAAFRREHELLAEQYYGEEDKTLSRFR